MRVVVVTTSYPRHDDDPSGHFVASSARALARSGADVHVIAPGGSVLDPPARRGELTIHRAGGSALFGWPGALARAREAPWRLFGAGTFAAGALYRLDRLGHVDRAVAHWIVPSAWPLLLRSRAPIEAVAHGADVRALAAAPELVRTAIMGGLLDRGTRFTFAARSSLETLAAAMGPLGPALRAASQVEPPAIDMPDVRALALAVRARLGGARQLVVTASRLVASKRIGLAIAAMSLARADVTLAIVGDGPGRAELERAAAPLGARVLFTGALPRREALSWVAAADVLVHPSQEEACPTIIREARELDVPVVACDAGDIAAWAGSDPGIVVVEGTGAGIAGGVERVLRRG